MKELRVKCCLYVDLVDENERAIDALNRLLDMLGRDNIAIDFYEYGTQECPEMEL